jgi:ABC-type sugar transport system substrate-binding protein
MSLATSTLLTLFTVVACSATPSQSTGTSGSNNASKPNINHQLVVASLVQPEDNPWVVNYVKFQKEVASALGIKLIVTADQGTEDSNVQAMEGLVAQKPDGIVFDPITQAAGLKDANLIEQNQIPSFTADRLVVPDIKNYTGKYLKGAVTEDNEMWGYNMMMALINQGSTKIAAIMDPHGVVTVEQAWKGAEKALKEHPNVKLITQKWEPHTREQAVQTTQQYLTEFGPGQIDGIMAFGSVVGEGALYAVQQAGRQSEIKISTCDDDTGVISLIKGGKLLGTYGGHWMVGGLALIELYDQLHGYKPLQPQSKFVLVKIDKNDATDYNKRFIEGQPFTTEQIRQMSQVYNKNANLPQIMQTLSTTWDAGAKK